MLIISKRLDRYMLPREFLSIISSSHLSPFNCKRFTERLRFSDSSDPNEFEDTKVESLQSNEEEEIYQIVKKESGNLLNKRRAKYEATETVPFVYFSRRFITRPLPRSK